MATCIFPSTILQRRVVQLSPEILDFSLREYVFSSFKCNLEGDFEITNTRIESCHAQNHMRSDLVALYFENVPSESSLAVRFFDPAGIGKRPWPNLNPSFYLGGWLQIEPEEGTLLVFEGHFLHDFIFHEKEKITCYQARIIQEEKAVAKTFEVFSSNKQL